jgi:hypothetical protein
VMAGLLDSLLEPEVRAEIAERGRIIGRIADTEGISRRTAAFALLCFEACMSSEGETIH